MLSLYASNDIFFDTPITFTVKDEIKFCSKFNGCFDLPSDNRPDPWLRNTYNAVLHRMDSVIIHILLLLIQPRDGKIKLMSLPVMEYPSLMNCSRYRRSLFTYASCLQSALRIFFCSIIVTVFLSGWRGWVIFIIILVIKKILICFHQHLC